MSPTKWLLAEMVRKNSFVPFFVIVIFFSAVQFAKADEVVKVPLKVNVLKGVEITDEKIKELVKEANKILKQADVAFEDPNISRNVSDENNNDDKIQNGEDNKLDEAGQKELNDTYGAGQGVKVYITNQVHDNNNTNGCAPHVTEDANGNLQGKPVIYLKNRPADSDKEKGSTLAHEGCHVFTLGDAEIIDVNFIWPFWNITISDSNGHVNDPNNLMYPYGKYTKDGNSVPRGTGLTEAQKNEIKKGAKRHATRAKTVTKSPRKSTAAPVHDVPVFFIHGGFVDDMFEPGIFNPFSDLGAGFLYAENPAANLQISLLTEGLYYSTVPPEMEFIMYMIAMNTDNDVATGVPMAGLPGADVWIQIRLYGHHPGGKVIAELHYPASGDAINLPFCSTQRISKIIDKTEYPEPPERIDYVDGVYLEVPMPLLKITANQIPSYVVSQNMQSGEHDEAGFTWQLYDYSQPVFKLLTPRIEPGQLVDFVGHNYKPFEPVEIKIDGDIAAIVPAGPDGSIHGTIWLDPSFFVFDVDDEYYDYFFVTAREAFGGREDFSIIELVPNVADIFADRVVNFRDLAVFADNWLIGF